MTMGRDPILDRYINLILNDLQEERDMKYRLSRKAFHNHDFMDGYAFGLRAAMDIIIGRKTDEV